LPPTAMQSQVVARALPWRALALLAVVVPAAGTRSQTPLRGGKLAPQSFVRSLSFKQKLRICNAYPFESPLDVYLGKIKITEEEPLAYRSCGEFWPELHADDEIDFKVDGTSAGTFTISDLPQNDAVLLMVIYRHSVTSTAVAFESHVFANLESPQIAVLDTYKGKEQAALRIQDVAQGKAHLRSEELRMDNVVAVDSGIYEVIMRDNTSNATEARSELVALPRESYIVIRCGVEAEIGKSYPEELMVFPNSDRRLLGAAAGLRPLLRGLFPLLLAALLALASAAPMA